MADNQPNQQPNQNRPPSPKRERSPTDAELSALRRVIDILKPMTPEARARVLAFVSSRIHEEPAPAAKPAEQQNLL